MRYLNSMKNYFTKTEKLLWFSSAFLSILAFIIFDRENYIYLFASLIGITSLIFNAKGNPFGQFLMVIFSIIYGYISYTYKYYGEMITYLGMTAPMALFALISWLKNPYKGNKAEVKVNNIAISEVIFMCILSVFVTYIFFILLKAFDTQNLFLSTLSVTTSFIAVYLTFRRSPLFALAYAANDIVLIALWILASLSDVSYLSVIICFVLFLVNDLYGYINWIRIKRKQSIQE